MALIAPMAWIRPCYHATPVVQHDLMRWLIVYLVLAAAFAAPVVLAATPAELAEASAGKIMAHDAWARASAGAAANGAVYITLTGGARPDRLMGIRTPVAAMAGVHESRAEGGVMRMRAIDAMPLLPGKTVTFAPGGYHIMLMELSHPLMTGQTFPLTLTFEHAAPMTVDVRVVAIGDRMTAGQDPMQMK